MIRYKEKINIQTSLERGCRMNRLKTFFLMALLTAIFLLLGGLIAGEEGLIVAFILAMATNFFSYWFSDRMAISMTRSQPLGESAAPEVYRALRELTYNANMPMPRVYLMPTDQPNAFATGRNPVALSLIHISVTAGLLRMLDYEELKGVLGHELAHIRNRDILIGSIAAAIAGALMFLSLIHISTLLAKFVNIACYLWYYLGGRSVLKIALRHLRPHGKIILEIYKVGLPTILIQVAAKMCIRDRQYRLQPSLAAALFVYRQERTTDHG